MATYFTHRSLAFTRLFITIAALCSAASAQLPAPPTTVEDALHQMADAAGIIFAGQVTAVRRTPARSGSTGIVEIDFAVTDPILGPAANTTYTLREWAGLWPAADTPFAIGQRYLIFLHAPGPSGLSSPVGGQDGAIPLRGTATPADPGLPATNPDAASIAAPISPHTTATNLPVNSKLRLVPGTVEAPASPSATLDHRTVDLRWIATRVLTPGANPSPLPPAPAAAPQTASPLSAETDLLALLRSWEKDRAAH